MRRFLAALACVLLWSAPALAVPPTSDAERAALRAIYVELVEIDTTDSVGDNTKAAAAVAARLRAGGLPAADVAELAPAPRKGNLVARLRAGRSAGAGEKPLILLAHLDVVEAKREDWSVEPFTLLEKDGYFYGRGTLDDKAMAAIFTEIVLRLARDHTPLRRDVILVLTADEEGGSHNGVDWLLKEHRALVDGGLVLNEGGGGRMRGGKYLLTGLQAAEKTYMDFELAVTNKGGHSSRPVPDNAIYRLANALAKLEKHAFPIAQNPVTRAYFERSAATEGGELGAAMAAFAKNPNDAAAAAKLAADPTYNAILRTTCVATQLAGGHAPNALPQRASATLNCRILPGERAADVQKQLERVIGDPELKITPLGREIAGPDAQVDPAFLAAVEKVSAELFPGVPVVPLMSAGATDSKYFRLAGIPAYGVSGIFLDVDDVRAHGRDERLGVKQLYEGQEFLWRLVNELAGVKQ